MRRKIVISALIGVILLNVNCVSGGGVPVIPPAAITGDNSGGAIAVYEIRLMSNSYVQVYAQKLSPDGDFLWGEKGILIGSGYYNWGLTCNLHTVSDGSGGAIVMWVEYIPQAEGEVVPSFQTYVAKIDTEGNVQWQRDIPGADRAIPDGSGGVIIAYRAPYEENISVLKVDAEGNLPWGEDGVSLNLGGCVAFEITNDNLGGVIVVEETLRGGDYIACAQRVDSRGNILWQMGGVQVCTGPVEGAQVVNDGSGGAIIVFMRDTPCEDGIGFCDSDIYAQRIDAEGNVLWGPDGVPICVGPSYPNSPGIVDDGAGGAVILFVFIGDYAAIHAQRIDADGHKLWNDDVELWKGDYFFPLNPVVSDGSGGSISVWYGGARAQRLDAAGRELWGPSGTTLTLRDVYLPQVGPDGCGGILISWSAVKFAGREVSQISYCVQRVDDEGNVVWGEGILLNT